MPLEDSQCFVYSHLKFIIVLFQEFFLFILMFFLYESAFLQFLITSYFIFTGILGYLLFLTNSLLVICLPCSVLTNFLSAVPLFKLFLFCLFSFAISYHLLCQSTKLDFLLKIFTTVWSFLGKSHNFQRIIILFLTCFFLLSRACCT